MDMMMKRSIVVLAAAFAMSTSALAENGAAAATNTAQQSKSSAVKLSDAELDGITAGAGAMSLVVIFNPGRADVLKPNNTHTTCINCAQIDTPAGTSGFVTVITPNGKVINVTIRQSLF